MKSKSVLIMLMFTSVVPLLQSQETFNWQSLYERALRTNASLAEGDEAALAAQYRWKSSRRSRGPQLFFESDLSYLTHPREVDLEAGSLYPGGTLAPGLQFPALPETDVSLPLSGNQWYSFRLVLEQPLIASGKLSARDQIYRSLWESSLLDMNQKKLLIKAEILTLTQSLFSLDEILNLVGQQLKAAERFVSLVRSSYDSGMTTHSDFLTAQVKAREITLMENQIRKQQNQALLHLEYLCGLEDLLPQQISPDGLPNLPLINEKGRDELLTETVAFSPVLLMLRRNIEGAVQNKKLVQGSSYGRPDLGLQLELDYAGGAMPFDENLTVSLGVRALLGDLGKAAADVKEADSRIHEAEHRYRDTLEQLKRSIGEELFNQKLAGENIDYYNSRAEDDLAMAQQKKESWETGYTLEQDYQLQLISWYSDRIFILQEEISLAVSRYRLMALTGVLP